MPKIKRRRMLVCDICADADNYGEPDACPCTNVVVVRQTFDLSYEDGSSQPFTNRHTLCFECRLTFYAYGDLIVAVA